MYAITSVAQVLHRYKTAKKKKSHSIQYVKYCTHCNHCMDGVHFHLLCFAFVGTVAIHSRFISPAVEDGSGLWSVSCCWRTAAARARVGRVPDFRSMGWDVKKNRPPKYLRKLVVPRHIGYSNVLSHFSRYLEGLGMVGLPWVLLKKKFSTNQNRLNQENCSIQATAHLVIAEQLGTNTIQYQYVFLNLLHRSHRYSGNGRWAKSRMIK